MYKTAKQLGIATGERKWLLKTAKVLARMAPKEARQIDGVNMGFDLANWFKAEWHNDMRAKNGKQKALCGTVGCIKGWMGTLAFASDNAIDLGVKLKGKKALPSKLVPMASWEQTLLVNWGHSDALHQLFTPDWLDDYQKVTPKDASKTIIRFLKTGLVEYPLKYYVDDKDHEIERRKEARRELRARA